MVPDQHLTNAVVFLDPDIGLQTGTASYLRRMGREKYLMYADLAAIWTRASRDTVVVVYQRLQQNALKRDEDVRRRLVKLEDLLLSRVWAIQWNDLAFLAVARRGDVGKRIQATLQRHSERHQLRLWSEFRPPPAVAR